MRSPEEEADWRNDSDKAGIYWLSLKKDRSLSQIHCSGKASRGDLIESHNEKEEMTFEGRKRLPPGHDHSLT
jgi:hypothetical protein